MIVPAVPATAPIAFIASEYSFISLHICGSSVAPVDGEGNGVGNFLRIVLKFEIPNNTPAVKIDPPLDEIVL